MEEQILTLQRELETYKSAILTVEPEIHTYMSHQPIFMTSPIGAGYWSFVHQDGNSYLQKNMRDGYGWDFGNQHMGFTILLSLNTRLISASGEQLAARIQHFQQTQGDLSVFQLQSSYRVDARWLPVSYDINTRQYTCISAETNQTQEVDDNFLLHPLVKVVDPIHEVSPNLA